MINLLFQIKFKLEAITESRPKEKRSLASKVILNACKLADTYVIYFYLQLKNKLGFISVKPLIDNNDLPIVSLTSFPARIDNLWMVLYCVYNQTKLPGKIVVTLTKEEVPSGFESLPNSLKYFADKGVEFIFADVNLRPHNKYFYTRQKYPDRIVITIDDDLLYYPDTIERLMRLHACYPNAVCTNRAHVVGYSNGIFTKSKNWPDLYVNHQPDHGLLGLGYSGVLYPPTFCSKKMYNAEQIKKLSLMADDMWLKVQELLENVKVAKGPYYAHPVTLPSSQKIALQRKNTTGELRNDKYLQNMNEYYHLENILSRLI